MAAGRGQERRQRVPRASTQVGTEGHGDGGRGQGAGLAGGELNAVVRGLDDIVAGPLGQAIDGGAAGVIVDQLLAAREAKMGEDGPVQFLLELGGQARWACKFPAPA